MGSGASVAQWWSHHQSRLCARQHRHHHNGELNQKRLVNFKSLQEPFPLLQNVTDSFHHHRTFREDHDGSHRGTPPIDFQIWISRRFILPVLECILIFKYLAEAVACKKSLSASASHSPISTCSWRRLPGPPPVRVIFPR